MNYYIAKLADEDAFAPSRPMAEPLATAWRDALDSVKAQRLDRHNKH